MAGSAGSDVETSIHSSGFSRLSSPRTEVLISVNPRAGACCGRKEVDRLAERLASAGLQAQVVSEIQRLSALSSAKTAAGTLRAVVACGGDGTVALVVNQTPVGTPIAVLPLGTENLLAKYLGLRRDPERLAEVIRRGACVSLDAGEANGKIFLLMAGCGFDAEVVRRMDQTRTGHIRHLSYFKPIVDSIRTYRYPELEITALDPAGGGSGSQPLRARWAFVANLPCYAAGLNVVPGADGTDGQLDVCGLRDGSLLSGLLYLGGVIAGQHHTWPNCRTFRARRVRIESAERVPYQLDGDSAGFLPVEIQVLPRRLTLIVPEDWRPGG